MTLPSVDEGIAAVRAALYFAAVPSHGVQLRHEPLPPGVSLLLRIVANDAEVIEFYAAHIEKSPKELREAAAFFLEQVIFTPRADSYRILGASRHAPAAELRRNFALLCRWLHSDICEELQRSVFLLRVTQAWNDLKTPERRAAYDASLNVEAGSAAAARDSKARADGRSASGGGKDNVERGPRLAKRVGNQRTIGSRRRRSMSLWRLITSGWGWRAN